MNKVSSNDDSNSYSLPFEKLNVWHEAKTYIMAVYSVCKHFPAEEKYGLGSQLTRAAVSIASNIAEGTSRTSYKDQAHFTQLAYGSLMETACQAIIAQELGFMSQSEYVTIRKSINSLANKLNSLRKYQLRQSNQ
jgi:four helix bundle protein